jgi:hypothetical protein
MGKSGQTITDLYCVRCKAPIQNGVMCSWQCEHDGVDVTSRPADTMEWVIFKVERIGSKPYTR